MKLAINKVITNSDIRKIAWRVLLSADVEGFLECLTQIPRRHSVLHYNYMFLRDVWISSTHSRLWLHLLQILTPLS